MGNFDKPYEELLFSDNFMFVKAMETRPDYLREMLELILSVKIDRIESISCEKNVDPFYDSKGIRLDVLVKDSYDNIYDAEMQVIVEPNLPKRSRYYHSAIDTEYLLKGNSYENLKPVYVIFICVGRLKFEIQKPVYFFQMMDKKTRTILDDKAYTIIVNSDYINGNPDGETLNDEMREFLYLVNKGKAQGGTDTLAKKIEKLVEDLKKKKEGRPKYMTAYEEIQIEGRRKYNEGREEGEFLNCIKLVEGGYITKEIAAESLGISVEEFNLKMQNSIK